MTDQNFDGEKAFEGLEQYAIVANRRQQWDTLLWQMPTMALTGEAFLFTISLGGSTSQTGRIVSSVLALVVAIASLHSLSAHRLSELTDSRWLHDHELKSGASEVHGVSWRERRMEVVKAQLQSTNLTDRLVARTYRFRSIEVWFWTMILIALTATSGAGPGRSLARSLGLLIRLDNRQNVRRVSGICDSIARAQRRASMSRG